MKPKELRAFQVNIASLKNGQHQFEFGIDDAFFEHYGAEFVEKGRGTCRLDLKKSETMLVFDFDLDVTVELVCDRSLDPFDYQVQRKEEMVVKFGVEAGELSDDVLVIDRETSQINVADWLHEYIGLGLPMKRLHPRYEGQESPDLVYQTGVTDDDENETDPRWEALKKLKK
jgi:uncharacterized protein